jgi:ATP-dependent protease Clp ATPase subunit
MGYKQAKGKTLMKTYEESKAAVTQALDVFRKSNGVIRPHILLTGVSGSGKTYLAETITREFGMPFLEINGAQLTNEGMSGNSLSKALVPLKNWGNGLNVVFIDEIDKLFVNGEDILAGREVKMGVQNELLKIMEAKTTEVIGDYGKYNQVEVSNTLFIFAGAFNGEETVTYDRLRDFGLRNEFLGRLGLLVHVPRPTLEHIYNSLGSNTIFNTYCKLYNLEPKPVADYLMGIISKYHENNNIGLRLINALCHQYFFNRGNIPDEVVESICLTKANVLIDFSKKDQKIINGSMSFEASN